MKARKGSYVCCWDIQIQDRLLLARGYYEKERDAGLQIRYLGKGNQESVMKTNERFYHMKMRLNRSDQA
jgi:hypothetical protein